VTDLGVVHVIVGICGIFGYGLRNEGDWEGRGLEAIAGVCNAGLERSCTVVSAAHRVLVVIE
jgi:hypothetical protein